MFIICYQSNITCRPPYCRNISYRAVPFSTTYYYVTSYHTFSTPYTVRRTVTLYHIIMSRTSYHTFRPPYCHVISYYNVTLHHILLSDHRTVTLYHIILSPLAQRTITLHHIIISAHRTFTLYHIIMSRYIISYFQHTVLSRFIIL